MLHLVYFIVGLLSIIVSLILPPAITLGIEYVISRTDKHHDKTPYDTVSDMGFGAAWLSGGAVLGILGGIYGVGRLVWWIFH